MAVKQKSSKKSTSVRRAEYAKAGRRSKPFKRPPKPRRGVAERDAQWLRRRRLHGAFGAAPVHVWNHLILGTSGRHKLSSKELTVLAAQIREAQKAHLYEDEEAS